MADMPEILPPESNRITRFYPSAPVVRKLSAAVLLALFLFFISQFFQSRGVGVLTSLFWLFGAWLVATILLSGAISHLRGHALSRPINIGIGAVLFGIALIMNYVYPMPATGTIVERVSRKHKNEFEKEFTIGYKLFGVANKEFFPFQAEPTEAAFIVHWERANYSWLGTNDKVTLHLPDIDFSTNFMLHDTTVSLPNEVGSSVTFRLDPKSFKYGAAFVSNIFERTRQPEAVDKEPSCTEQLQNNVVFNGFPGSSSRIVAIVQTIVVWGTTDCYREGKLQQNGAMLNVIGGTLRTSRVDVFDDTGLIRGNRFIGGPRGGYSFPKAGAVLGNEFLESIFDASRLPDGAIVASNHFMSAKGVYRIGPQPDMSFVVKIVQTEKDGAVLLFGAKPYKDDETP